MSLDNTTLFLRPKRTVFWGAPSHFAGSSHFDGERLGNEASMYCGDDVEAIVGDVGTSSGKFGLAGEDTPKIVIPTTVGVKSATSSKPSDSTTSEETPESSRYALRNLLHHRQDEILHPVDACVVKDWDAMEAIWNLAFEELRVEPREHPVITSSPACFAHERLAQSAAKDNEKYMEMMFEKFDAPCFYLAKDAVLDAFAFGRSSALIVEIGAGASRVVPIYDGYPLQRPAQCSYVGGNVLDEYLGHLLRQQEPAVEVRPRCCFRRKVHNGKLETILEPTDRLLPPHMTASYLAFMKAEVLREARESICMMQPSLMTEDEKRSIKDNQEEMYELPDGSIVSIEKEKTRVAELLLSPSAFTGGKSKSKADADGDVVMKTEPLADPKDEYLCAAKGLHRMIYDAVQLCDADLRRDMLGNIILCGGGSLMNGLTERLHAEVCSMVPSTFKVRFTNVMRVEKQFSCFIGGSILASLGSFQQLWVAKKEFEEHGAARLCAQRFF